MMHFEDTFHDSCEQQRAKGHDMHGCQGVGELLIIAGQAMASPRPGTTPLHHPASWQQHEAFPGLGQPRHLPALYAIRLTHEVAAVQSVR